MADKSKEKKNFFSEIIAWFKRFFKGLKAEIRKIIWPTKEQVGKQTAAVVIISAVMCGFIVLIDFVTKLLVGLAGSIF